MKELRLCDSGKFEQVLDLCNKYKLGIEIQSFHDPYRMEREPDLVQKHIYGLSGFQYVKSLHAPFWELNIGSKIHGVSRTSIEMFQYAYDMACMLGCTGVIVHNGYLPKTYVESGWISRAAARWNEFLSDKSNEITFYIENQFELSGSLLSQLIDEVNNPRLKICFDIGHAHAHSTYSVMEWIELLSKRIGYVHIHNNNGIEDEHLGIMNGTIPTLLVMEALEIYAPDAIWSLESNINEMEESIRFLKRNK